jgi:cytidylate kinase
MLITISREYAAGGSEVARLVADGLGWEVIDNEFIDRVAERAGLSHDEVAELEEKPPSFLDRFFRSTVLSAPELFPLVPEATEALEERTLIKATRHIVTELAKRGRVVMVGRAAAAVLAREHDALHVSLVAPREFRIRTAMQTFGFTREEATRTLDETDRNRARYHREYYQRDWRSPLNYHMVLNTGALGFEGAAAVVVAHCRRLGW